MNELGKALIILGCAMVVLGALLRFGGKLPWFGRLPGDIHIEHEHLKFYFPLMTCLIISILLTVFFRLIGKR